MTSLSLPPPIYLSIIYLSLIFIDYLGVGTLTVFSSPPILIIQCASASLSLEQAGREERISEISYFFCPIINPKLWFISPTLPHTAIMSLGLSLESPVAQAMRFQSSLQLPREITSC